MIDIKELIPHRSPMLLVDEISELDQEQKKITGSKTIQDDEYFLQGHFPGNPIVPGAIICESLFQAGAALMSALSKDGLSKFVPVVTRVGQAKFKKIVRPGDKMELRVTLDQQVGSAYYLKGRALVNGKLSASVDFTVMLAPASLGAKE